MHSGLGTPEDDISLQLCDPPTTRAPREGFKEDLDQSGV